MSEIRRPSCGVYGERMGRGIDPAERARILTAAGKRSRESRWSAPGRARVIHPTHGTAVVPHSSNLAAIMNAAEDPDGLIGTEIAKLVAAAHINYEAKEKPPTPGADNTVQVVK